MKTNTVIALGSSAIVALTVLASAPATYAEDIIIGTGSPNNIYHQTGRAICALINRKIEGLTCSARPTTEPIISLDNLRTGALDFGVIPSDAQYHAIQKSGPFTFVDATYEGIRSVLSVSGVPLTVLARRDAGISKLDDLAGKRVNIGNPGSSQRALMDLVMTAKGWTKKDFQLVEELPASEQSLALCHNRVQATVHAVGHPSAAIRQAVELCDAVLVEVAGGEIEKLIGDTPYFTQGAVPGGLYENNPQPTATFGIMATLVATADTDADLVYRVVRAVVENFDLFRRMQPASRLLDESALGSGGITAPLHDGARRYYSERGLM